MRTLIIAVLLVFSAAVQAQTISPSGFMDYLYPGYWRTSQLSQMGNSNKKWFLTHYTAVSTSFQFFKGGNATVVSVPVGLQLNRKLNENLYAFAAVSAAPAYINFNGMPGAGFSKSPMMNSALNGNTLAMYGRAELGLMYVNDAKTFSISGSVGVQRSTYTGLPYQPVNPKQQQVVRSAAADRQ